MDIWSGYKNIRMAIHSVLSIFKNTFPLSTRKRFYVFLVTNRAINIIITYGDFFAWSYLTIIKKCIKKDNGWII